MIKQFLRKHGWRYIPGIVFLILNSYLTSWSPIFLGNAIDGLNHPPGELDKRYVYTQVGLLVGAAVLVFIARYIWRYFINGNARNLEQYLREALFVKFQNMPADFYSSNKTGDLMAMATNDINAVRMTAGMAVANILSGVSTIAFSIFKMTGTINLKLALFSLLPIPFAIFFVVYTGGRIRRKFSRVQQMFAHISGTIQENIMGMRVIKAFAQEKASVEDYVRESEEMREANIDLVNTSSTLQPLIQIFFGISFMISLILGSNMVLGGEISVGELVAFNNYILLIMGPVVSIGRIINSIERGRASLRRLDDVFSLSEIAPEEFGEYDKEIRGNISVRNLVYAYENDAMNVLDGISFDLKAGQVLGIVGETGSGKTTLINLLLKFQPAPRGTIFLDGTDLQDIPSKAVRECIGYVPQEEFLFNTTIGENISFYQDGCTQQMIEEASEYSDLKKDMTKFANGYDTPVGERGRYLSGGQKKRVIIARAIAKHPGILIFDDVLSSVDVNTEKIILSNLRKAMEGKTAIIISQRISALRDANLILYLENGRIAEHGTHDELLEKNGLYAKLYYQQSQKAQEENPLLA